MEIVIEKKPRKINIDDLEINARECQDNSIKVITKYNHVEYVEGVLLIIDKNNQGKAVAHAWNKLNEVYFDVTKEVNWKGEGFNEIIKEKYLIVKSYHKNKLTGIPDFSDETKQLVKEINEELIKRAKVDEKGESEKSS